MIIDEGFGIIESSNTEELKNGEWVPATPMECPSWWAVKWEAICDWWREDILGPSTKSEKTNGND